MTNEIIEFEQPGTDITVVIGTFGEEAWRDRALNLASSLLRHQKWPPCKIVVSHQENLARARNEGAEQANSTWLMFLDADDDLHSDFIYNLDLWFVASTADILQPSVQGFNQFGLIDPEPQFTAMGDMIRRNWLTIGCPLRTNIFHKAEGFSNEWECLEDWAFWLKCVIHGAKVVACPKSVYLINDDHGRSKNPREDAIANDIRRRYRAAYETRMNL